MIILYDIIFEEKVHHVMFLIVYKLLADNLQDCFCTPMAPTFEISDEDNIYRLLSLQKVGNSISEVRVWMSANVGLLKVSEVSSSQEKTQTKQHIYNGVKINDCDIRPLHQVLVLEISELYFTLKCRCMASIRPPDMPCMLLPSKVHCFHPIMSNKQASIRLLFSLVNS